MSTSSTPKRFKLRDEIYEFASQADINMRDWLMLQAETDREVELLGRSLNMGEIVRLGDLFKSLTPEESRIHPESGWMFAVTMWMSMVKRLRDAGDTTTRVSFVACITAFNFADFTPIKDPVDRQASASGKARKAAKKSPARKAGPPVDVPAEAVIDE